MRPLLLVSVGVIRSISKCSAEGWSCPGETAEDWELFVVWTLEIARDVVEGEHSLEDDRDRFGVPLLL